MLGVNAVAESAGVEKVLIDRDFASLEGLVKAYAERSDIWPSLTDAPHLEHMRRRRVRRLNLRRSALAAPSPPIDNLKHADAGAMAFCHA